MANNAASNGLSLSLSVSSDSVAAVAVTHENSGSASNKDTLFHGETILIVASGDLEDISLELITEIITTDFLSHSLAEELKPKVVSEIACLIQFFVVINNDGLLKTSNRVRNV